MKKQQFLSQGDDVRCTGVLSNNVLPNIKCVAFISSLIMQVAKGNGSSPNTFTVLTHFFQIHTKYSYYHAKADFCCYSQLITL